MSIGGRRDGRQVERVDATVVLDTLERNGYIERHADADDRRRVLVEITPAAQDLLDRMLPRVQQVVTTALAGIDEDALHALLATLNAVRDGIASTPNDLPPPPKRRTPARLRRRPTS